MARYRADTINSCTTDALFRAWSQALHDGIIAAGLVQTSDTGQVNLATMVVPGAAGFAGYEVFKFNDALQATKPIFLKVEYGRGTATTIPRVQFTVGPTTDGAGGVSVTWGAAILPSITSGATVPHACFFSGEHTNGSNDTSGIVITLWSSNSVGSADVQFFIDRSRDADGAPTGDGLAYGTGAEVRILAYAGVWSTTNCAQLRQMVTIPTSESIASTMAKGLSPDGDVFYWQPLVLACPLVPAWRTPLLVGVHPYDVGAGSTFDIAVNGGEDTTYLQPGIDLPTGGIATYGSSTANVYFLSQLWENPPP